MDWRKEGRERLERGSGGDETLTLVVHVDIQGSGAVRLSEHGDDSAASWVPRSLIRDMNLLGKTVRGFDRRGQAVSLPLAEVTMAAWKAKQEGWL